MKVVRRIAELDTAPGTGLVPTMGSLHAGHRALLAAARRENDRVVMSLFVNPAQFDDTSDLAAYPRDEARDLTLPVKIRVVPTVRDDDGLALSSRNVRLSPEERALALDLPRALEGAVGAPDPVAAARAALNGLTPDYVEMVDLDGATVLAAAVRVGSTRLIDNVLLEGEIA